MEEVQHSKTIPPSCNNSKLDVENLLMFHLETQVTPNMMSNIHLQERRKDICALAVTVNVKRTVVNCKLNGNLIKPCAEVAPR